ncbi:MarR family winged helix-turn-helix transcriptional regulator [Brevibacterium sp. ZH18]|uniref:MarR family winged helix-turn-helix transcriptional regulator n=1 Tax=Brevibacterium sp. ZH18 TaxID=2927784 RepID=UPI001F60630E|nr:MarR family winged helix-turn-helix transcriptional regulator [Brevibacterium sp. ZH18]MCI4012673.1 MarR family winged helix-turn-helix transcriptional regulator [Brevibacterium sp. ZH18]
MNVELEDREPNTPVDDFGWSLGALLRAYHHAVAEVLGDFPHGPRGYQVLHTVVHGDQPSQLALATRLGIDRTVMTYLIDDLIEAGLVERQPNPNDRRQRKIVSTDHGTQSLAELEARVREAQDAALSPLDSEERAMLCTLVRRVANGTGNRENPCDMAEDMLDTYADSSR